MKNIKIRPDIHHCLKVLAAQNDRGIFELVEALLLQGMKQIVIEQTHKGVLPKASLISRLLQAAEEIQRVPQNGRRKQPKRSSK